MLRHAHGKVSYAFDANLSSCSDGNTCPLISIFRIGA